MTKTYTTHTELEALLPHRFENLLLDSVEANDLKEGQITLTIDKNDSLGRDIFFEKDSESGEQIMMRPVLMEILALGSVVASGGIKDTELLLYAGMKDITFSAPLKLGHTLTGQVHEVSQKGPFTQYYGEISDTNASPICKGYMTAFITDKTENPVEAFIKRDHSFEIPEPIIQHTISFPDKKKEDCMKCANTLLHASDKQAVASYIYPENHPLIKGHFPETPVMMGVMQLISVEDTLQGYLNYQGETVDGSVSCNANIFHINNDQIASIKGLVFNTTDNDQDEIDITLASVKKVMFKAPISPGDTIYIVLSDIKVTNK